MSHYLNKEEREVKAREVAEAMKDQNYTIPLTFQKDDRGWAAVVPEHTRSENAMVAGADVVIDRIAQGDDTVEVRFRTEESSTLGKPLVKLTRFAHLDDWGAEYMVQGVGRIPFPAYICNVGHNVMGEHAPRLFVYEVRHYNR